MPESRLPDGAHIGRVQLRVADLERSLGLYRDLLGFQLLDETAGTVTLAPGDDVDDPASLHAARALIVLHEKPGVAPRPRRPTTTGLYHVALLVPSRRALGRAIVALQQAEYPLRGASDHAVSESLYLDDPDGNGLEIYADRPRSEWPVVGGQVQMTVDPMDMASVLAAAQERPAAWAGLPAETVVGHVHFTVSDQDRATAFYRDVIGFDVTMRVPTLTAVSAGGYHHHLNLNTWAGEGAVQDTERMAGLVAWELALPGDAPALELRTRLERAGVASDNAGGSIVARDPDGIPFEVRRTS